MKYSKAIFTVQHDEDFFLPLWIKYYSESFDLRDIYIVAHNTTDITKDILLEAESLGINVEYLETNEIFNHDWLNSVVHQKQRDLLKKYDYVVFADCDEIIIPIGKTLGEFIDEGKYSAYRTFGYNVIEGNMYRDDRYDKTLISAIPLIYSYGYHTADIEFPANENLHLYHLHKLDYEEAWKRSLRLSQEKWDKLAVDTDMSAQNRITDKEKFDFFFYEESPNQEPRSKEIEGVLNRIYKNSK